VLAVADDGEHEIGGRGSDFTIGSEAAPPRGRWSIK
jgi:hypothetical protein